MTIPLLNLALLILAHWIGCGLLINRLHATALPYWFLKLIDALWYAALVAGPLLLALWLLVPADAAWVSPTLERFGLPPDFLSVLHRLAAAYAPVCALIGAWGAISWWVGKWIHDGERLIVSQQGQRIDLTRTPSGHSAASWGTRLLAGLPGNQVFQLAVQTKTLELPNLPPALGGMSIVHLSDLHFTGRTAKGFYEAIVRQANELDGDYVVITGDIIDKALCFSWLHDVLGRLQARHRRFFVLGNHDLRVRDEPRLRGQLEAAGLTDLGGRALIDSDGAFPVLWAGNELPWFSPAGNPGDLQHDPRCNRAFRILISHSPDQIPWARAHGFHLMLAGHTHGGQIRFPVVGPVFSPSRFGVRYASGTFYVQPTVLHVSRGLSGTRALRFDCPPELTKLVLQRTSHRSEEAEVVAGHQLSSSAADLGTGLARQ